MRTNNPKNREQAIINLVDETIYSLQMKPHVYGTNLVDSSYLNILEDVTNIICTKTRIYDELLADVIGIINRIDVDSMNDMQYASYRKLINKIEASAKSVDINVPVVKTKNNKEQSAK